MSVLTDALPTIATFLGGPVGGLATEGVEWLANKLGLSDKSVEAVKTALAGYTPDQLMQMKQMDIEFQKFCMDNSIKLQLAQIEVDSDEAKSTNWFVAGWRPAVGWVCVVALALIYWPKAIVLTSIWTAQCVNLIINTSGSSFNHLVLPAFPDLGATDLLGLLGSILGLGAMRTFEKHQGVEGNR